MRDRIKPQSNKIEAILALQPPTNVGSNRNMWMRRSDMLAPLTDLIRECGQTKTTKAKGTKKASWHWEIFTNKHLT